jgi:hypothetical protein
MGWGTGKFIRLSLREESGLTLVGDDLGDLPGAPVQSASDVCRLALCHRVCIDGRGHGQYLQEISVSGLILGGCRASVGSADSEWAGKEGTVLCHRMGSVVEHHRLSCRTCLPGIN